jgi:hypothetical protein
MNRVDHKRLAKDSEPMFCRKLPDYQESLDKKPLRGLLCLCCKLGATERVLMLRRTADPEMGQELYMLGCMLRIPAEDSLSRMRRLSWMDGSDSDDEDPHSRDYASGESVSVQLRSVTILFIV